MTRANKRTPEAKAATDLILEVFRLNGLLLAAGDRLTADLGLTSARWQVMGAIADAPLTVAAIGRRMGLTRQAVLRVANDLAAQGFAAFADNPDHKRAKLLGLTDRGRKALAEITRRQIAWSNDLADGLALPALRDALTAVRALRTRLED
jgi:DNA-binding MarR family transcriptional regulator